MPNKGVAVRSCAALEERLFAPVDAASLAAFRIAFGALILWDVGVYFAYDLIHYQYLRPLIRFKYYGFDWVEPWPGYGLYIHFGVLGLAALLVMLGLFYRVAIVVLTIAFTYVFLLDQTVYLNHFYFVILLACLLSVVPAHRVWSLDARRRNVATVGTVPGWSVWVLRAQIEIMLLYAGIVKINPDWLRLVPLRDWLADSADLPVIGPLLLLDWVVATAAYGSIVLHVAGAPLLLFRRTRIWAFALYCVFHVSNHVLFNIGIFPWLTIAGTTIFFAPDWPRHCAARLATLARQGRAQATGR